MLVILMILVILMVAGVPSLPWGQRYGYGWGPSGLLGVVLVVLLLYFLLGHHISRI